MMFVWMPPHMLVCEDSGSSIMCFLVSKDLILILIFSQFALGSNSGVVILALYEINESEA